jgi:hypothetical protein
MTVILASNLGRDRASSPTMDGGSCSTSSPVEQQVEALRVLGSIPRWDTMKKKEIRKLEDRWRELVGLGYRDDTAWREVQREMPEAANEYIAMQTDNLVAEIETYLEGT